MSRTIDDVHLLPGAGTRDGGNRTITERTSDAMCLTCGCMKAHLDMGEHNIRYEDLKAAADENGVSVGELLDTWERTLEIDRKDHPAEYAG